MFDTDNKVIGVLGIVLGAISVLLSFMYGTTLANHWLMCLLFGLVTGTMTGLWAFLPSKVLNLYHQRKWLSLALAAPFLVLAGLQDLVGNYSSSAWQINGGIQAATVQNVRYDNRQKTLQDNRKLLNGFRERLAKLNERHQWLPTVTTAAMKAKLESANLAIKQEAARGGCGPICLEKTRERDEILSRIAISSGKAKLEEQIAATTRVIQELTGKAEVVEKSSSGAKLRNAAIAGWYELSPETSEIVEYWVNAVLLVLFALLLWAAPPLCRLICVGAFDSVTGARPVAQSNLASLQPAVDEPPQIKDVAPAPTKPDMHLGITTVADLAKQRIRERLAQSNIQVAV